MGLLLEGVDSAPEVEREVALRDKKGDWEAGKKVRNCGYKNMIHSPMIHRGYHVYHSTREIMQLRNCLPAFLQLQVSVRTYKNKTVYHRYR
jgi:hypothetical protein